MVQPASEPGSLKLIALPYKVSQDTLRPVARSLEWCYPGRQCSRVYSHSLPLLSPFFRFPMSNIAERYTRLCRSYVQLSDKFQKLDVDHMTLRGKVAPLLKSLQAHKLAIEKLQHEKAELEAELHTVTTHYEELKPLVQEKATWEATLQAVTAKYEALRPFEVLLEGDNQAALADAEAQLALVDETLQEMAIDSDPDLDGEAKQLLASYDANPQAFEAVNLGMPLPDLREMEREKVLVEP